MRRRSDVSLSRVSCSSRSSRSLSASTWSRIAMRECSWCFTDARAFDSLFSAVSCAFTSSDSSSCTRFFACTACSRSRRACACARAASLRAASRSSTSFCISPFSRTTAVSITSLYNS